MFSCLQILEAFLWFVLITLLNVTLIILTLSVSRLLNLLLRLVAFLLFLNPQCLASISRWITASSSWKRFCLFVCRALSWIATDRSRARRCVEACVYGTLDFVGYPRFPAPVEFIAAVIAYYVHPVNIQTACLIMEGAEFTENIINGVE